MIQRDIEKELKNLINQVPVVTILGPRQSGKTTLAKELFSTFSYANLEHIPTRELAKNDPEGFFEKFKEPIIIDEVQRVPELLSTIQVLVDQNRLKNGRFILTGSHQPILRQNIAQSLAGRTSLMTLLPLSINEISNGTDFNCNDVDSLLLKGFMPELYRIESRRPTTYYRDYFDTYIERDLRQLVNVKDLDSYIKFMKLLAGRTGQILNLSSLSNDVGVSSTTLTKWISVLESSFVVFTLQPYYSNISKQLIKSPKIYFSEVGLATYLLGLSNQNQISRDPLRGNLFETMVVSECLKARLNNNEEPNLFFLRTAKGLEVDLLLNKEGNIYPFEIKSAKTPNIDYTRSLLSIKKAENSSIKPTVIYTGEYFPSFAGVEFIHYSKIKSKM
ncbi:MAG: ATP-binding protein [Sphaerochaetaceae bacterium]|nr:ATP-binding protein [Sphaerochaetaceae bacterium]